MDMLIYRTKFGFIPSIFELGKFHWLRSTTIPAVRVDILIAVERANTLGHEKHETQTHLPGHSGDAIDRLPHQHMRLSHDRIHLYLPMVKSDVMVLLTKRGPNVTVQRQVQRIRSEIVLIYRLCIWRNDSR